MHNLQTLRGSVDEFRAGAGRAGLNAAIAAKFIPPARPPSPPQRPGIAPVPPLPAGLHVIARLFAGKFTHCDDLHGLVVT